MKKLMMNLAAIAFATASYADSSYTLPVQSVEPVDHQLGVPVFERDDNWGTEGYCIKNLDTDATIYIKINRASSEVPQVLVVATDHDIRRNNEIHQFVFSHQLTPERLAYRYGKCYNLG